MRAASFIVSLIIVLALAGPTLGFLTLGHTSSEIGFSVDTSVLQSQLNNIFSSGENITQLHEISVPVHNAWIFPSDASLKINLQVSGNVVYETSGSVELNAFQSGHILIPFQISQSQLTELQGNKITVGGSLSFGDPGYLWTVDIPLSQGGW